MSKIALSDINPAGSELFQDGENLLNELNDQEMEQLAGGYFGGYGPYNQSVNINSNVGNSNNANSNNNANTIVSNITNVG